MFLTHGGVGRGLAQHRAGGKQKQGHRTEGNRVQQVKGPGLQGGLVASDLRQMGKGFVLQEALLACPAGPSLLWCCPPRPTL